MSNKLLETAKTRQEFLYGKPLTEAGIPLNEQDKSVVLARIAYECASTIDEYVGNPENYGATEEDVSGLNTTDAIIAVGKLLASGKIDS